MKTKQNSSAALPKRETGMDMNKTSRKRRAPRKCMSLFLIFSIMASFFVLPEISASAYSGGSGTADDPYLISTAADLNSLATASSSSYFKQTANITWSTSTGIQNFYGHYDGNGYNIAITLSKSGQIGTDYNGSNSYTGLFNKISGAEIYNLRVSGTVTFTASYGGSGSSYFQYLGGIVAYATNSNIHDCYSSVNLTGNYVGPTMGGIVGYMYSGSTSASYIDRCAYTGTMSCNNSTSSGGAYWPYAAFGGIVGAYEGATSSTYYYNSSSGYSKLYMRDVYAVSICTPSKGVTGSATYKSGLGGLIGCLCGSTSGYNTYVYINKAYTGNSTSWLGYSANYTGTTTGISTGQSWFTASGTSISSYMQWSSAWMCSGYWMPKAAYSSSYAPRVYLSATAVTIYYPASINIASYVKSYTGTLSYSSSSTSVATMSGSTATSKTPGTSTITITSTLNGLTYSRTLSLTVNKGTPSMSVTLQSNWTYTGSAKNLIASSSISTNGGTRYYYASTTQSTPSSSYTGSTSYPTATNAGTYYVYYRAAASTYYNAVSWTYKGAVTVSKASRSISLANTEITKDFGSADFDVGATISSPTASSGGSMSYSSDNTSVISIVSNKAHIVGEGTANVTVSSVSNSNYNDAASQTVKITVNAVVPGAPASLTAKSGEDKQITLNWTAPTFNGGRDISGYTVWKKKSTDTEYTQIASLSGTELSYVDKGLENGTTYDYQLYAANTVGTSTAYASASAKPYKASGAVSDAKTRAYGAHSLYAEWKAPLIDNGDTPSSYKVQVYSEEACTNLVCESTGTANTDGTGFYCVITDEGKLKKGTQYFIKIIPVNGAGDGEATVVSAYTMTKPDSPKNVTAKATADGEITVYWDEPTFLGYSNSDDAWWYTIDWWPTEGGSRNTVTVQKSEGTGTELTDHTFIRKYSSVITADKNSSDSKLQRGKTYKIGVYLHLDTSDDVAIASDAAYTEQICAWLPVAPVVPDAMVSTYSGVYVESATCADNSGDTITEYAFFARKHGTSEEFKEFARVRASNEKLVSAYGKDDDNDVVENGVEYDFAVAAVNSVGVGALSEPQTVTPGIPTKVENVRITPETGQKMTVTFDPSDSADVTYYELCFGGTIYGEEQTTIVRTTEDTSYSYNAGDRINGDIVSVYVIVHNIYGVSEASETVTSRVGSPSSPAMIKCEPREDGLDLEWTASSHNGNALQYYTAYVTDTTDADPAKHTIYRYKTSNAKILNMSLSTGAIDETGAMTSYDNYGNEFKLLTKYTYPFTDGHTYEIYITCTNSAGESAYSNIEKFTFAAPAEPQNIAVEPADGTLTVSWDKVASDGGYKLTGYNIYLNDDADPTMKVTWSEIAGESVTYQIYTTDYRKGNTAVEYKVQDNLNSFTVVIDNLANGYAYTARVTAINEMGEGPDKSSDEPQTPRTKASEPLDIKPEPVSGTEIDVSWRQPLNNGGTPISGYMVRAYKVTAKNYETREYEAVDAETASAVAAVKSVTDGTSCTVNALEAGYGYRFEVTAVTLAGEGAIGESEEVRTNTKPSKPVITDLDSAVGTADTLPVTVRWLAPEDDGNSPIVGYDVYVETYKMNKELIPADTLEYVINDNRVKRGNVYNITVIAYNAVTGTVKSKGTASDAKSVLVGSIPAPKNVSVTGTNDGTLNITWPMDQYAGMEEYISRYFIYINDVKVTTTTSNNVELTLRPCGVPQKVEVSVVSKATDEEGNKSLPVTITLGVPDMVTGVTLTPDQEEIAVEWTPVDMGSDIPVTQYTVYANGKQAAVIGSAEEGAPALTANDASTILTGLKGGTEYSITVTASNVNGEGVESTPVKATPWSEPDTPVVTDITPGLDEFTFTYKDGSGNGAAINNHKVYLGGAEVAAEKLAFNNTNKTVTVSGVTNGEKLEFYITAVNAKGLESAAPSAPYSVITGVPLAPANVAAKAGSGSAAVTFTASEDIEGYPIRYYCIWMTSADEELGDNYIAKIDAETGKTTYSYTQTGLTNGHEYVFTVTAANDLGTSEHSMAAAAKPGTPSAPTVTSVTPSSGSLTAAWDAPKSENAGRVTKYAVYVNGVQALTTPETSAEIKDLDNGKEYEITVSAYNYVGEGAKSDGVTAVPGGPPGEVSDINMVPTYTADDGCGVIITWKEPEDTGNQENVWYKVEGDGTIKVSGCKAVITGLNPGENYKFNISAVSDAGEGKAVTTDTVTMYDRPGAPVLVGVYSYNQSFIVTWTAPASDGNTDITSYTIYLEPYDSTDPTLTYEVTKMPDANAEGEMSATVSIRDVALSVGQKYNISVSATNVVGESKASSSTRLQLNDAFVQTVPSAPTNLAAAASDSKVTLTWAEPITDGYSTITKYVIWAGANENNMGYLAEVDGHTFSYTDTKVTNGTARCYKVKAVNAVSADGGPFTDIVSATPVKINAPTAPVWLTFDDTNGVSAYETNPEGDTLTFKWTASEGDTLGGAISYEVYVNGTLMTTTADTQYAMTPVSSGVRYNVQVKAVNEVGGATLSEYLYAYRNLNIRKGSAEDGFTYDSFYDKNIFANIDADYDGVQDHTSAYSTPSAPVNATLTQSTTEAKAIVAWDKPADDGNKDITKYVVYISTNGETTTKEISATSGLTTLSSGITVLSEDGKVIETESQYSCDIDINYGQLYTVYVKAVNEIGEGEATDTLVLVPFPETPVDFDAKVSEKVNTEISWKLMTLPEHYLLYVNGEATTIEKTEVAGGTEHDANGYLSYTYTLKGQINQTYSLALSAVYKNSNNELVESSLTSFKVVSTKETPADAPTNVTAVTNELDSTKVTVSWTPPLNGSEPEVDAASYKLYVNGEPYSGSIYINDELSADGTIPYEGTTSIDIENVTDKSLIKLAAVSTNETEGALSTPVQYSAETEPEHVPGTPGKPTELGYTLNYDTDGKTLLSSDNITITWKSAPADETDEANKVTKTDKFYVYFGSELKDTITAADDGSAAAEYSTTLTVKAGEDYNIVIVPASGEGADEIKGLSASKIAEIPAPEYPDPTEPVLTAQLSDDKSKITLSWTAEADTEYYLTVNGVKDDAADIASQSAGYEFTISDPDVTNYIFKLEAVKKYESGTVIRTIESQEVNVSTTDTPAPIDTDAYKSNPPVITGTISNGLDAVKVYWKAPQERLEGEQGTIYRYVVIADGTTLGSVDASDILVYEIPFETSAVKSVVIQAVKKINNADYVSAVSAVWKATPNRNIIDPLTEYERAQDLNPANLFANPAYYNGINGLKSVDADGDGIEDAVETYIDIPAVSTATGDVTITFTNQYNHGFEITSTFEKDDHGNGIGTIKVPTSSAKADVDPTFTIVINKPAHLPYTITDVTYDDLDKINLDDITLYVGDLNEDGIINSVDLSKLKGNMGSSKASLDIGDLNEDGVINSVDLSKLKGNMGVNSITVSINDITRK